MKDLGDPVMKRMVSQVPDLQLVDELPGQDVPKVVFTWPGFSSPVEPCPHPSCSLGQESTLNAPYQTQIMSQARILHYKCNLNAISTFMPSNMDC